ARAAHSRQCLVRARRGRLRRRRIDQGAGGTALLRSRAQPIQSRFHGAVELNFNPPEQSLRQPEIERQLLENPSSPTGSYQRRKADLSRLRLSGANLVSANFGRNRRSPGRRRTQQRLELRLDRLEELDGHRAREMIRAGDRARHIGGDRAVEPVAEKENKGSGAGEDPPPNQGSATAQAEHTVVT